MQHTFMKRPSIRITVVIIALAAAAAVVIGDLARHAAGQAIPANEQQVYLTPFRPERAFLSAVAARQDCSTCQRPSRSASRVAAA